MVCFSFLYSFVLQSCGPVYTLLSFMMRKLFPSQSVSQRVISLTCSLPFSHLYPLIAGSSSYMLLIKSNSSFIAFFPLQIKQDFQTFSPNHRFIFNFCPLLDTLQFYHVPIKVWHLELNRRVYGYLASIDYHLSL